VCNDLEPAVNLIRVWVPEVVAVYLFGSAARDDQTSESDIDLAYLAPKSLPPKIRWDLQQEVAVLLHRDVDLIDLRSSSTVMRVRVLADSQLLLDLDPYTRATFEATALGAYARLNVERKYILEDVSRRGQVYG
jgi:predicted nucleotidyltransferase